MQSGINVSAVLAWDGRCHGGTGRHLRRSLRDGKNTDSFSNATSLNVDYLENFLTLSIQV